MRILTITEQAHIWEEFARRIDFSPSVNREVTPFDFHGLPCVRYALDWQHDCFLSDPRERQELWFGSCAGCRLNFYPMPATP